jgi:hypothetical protein
LIGITDSLVGEEEDSLTIVQEFDEIRREMERKFEVEKGIPGLSRQNSNMLSCCAIDGSRTLERGRQETSS